MPGYSASFGKGFLIGAGAATAVAVARYYGQRRGEPRLIDWERASAVAIQTAGQGSAIQELEKARLQAEYEQLVRSIEQPISDYTGTALPLGNITVQAMDRVDWIRANVTNFQALFAPIDEVYAETARDSAYSLPVLSDLSRLMLSTQVGLLIGYLARKVLGQYDISLLGREPLTPGKLYFVEPNIRALGQTLEVPLDELRLWIALHEATHAHEFEVNPWVRSFLNSHLENYIRSLLDDLRTSGSSGLLGPFGTRLLDNVRDGRSLLESLMTPDQRRVLSELQALMSLAEGYCNHVMNHIGRVLMPHFDEIHRRVEQRQRQRGRAEELFLRLTGLKMKMEQYRLGEQFATRVAQERGMPFLNRAWSAREHLPTEEEIREPERWIARQDQVAA